MARKKKKQAEDDGGSDFMMLFTALTVILLAFFILLTTMAVPNDSKKRLALGSVFGSFGILPSGMMFEEKGESLHNSNQLIEQISVFARLLTEIRSTLEVKGLLAEGTVAKFNNNGMYPRLILSNSLFYSPGGVEISPGTFPVLDKVANAAKNLGGTIIVEGHTSKAPVPLHSKAPSHWELSTFRAVQIQRYLIEAGGLPSDRVHAEGHAYHHPDVGKDRIIIVFQHPTARQKDLMQTKTQPQEEIR